MITHQLNLRELAGRLTQKKAGGRFLFHTQHLNHTFLLRE